MEIKGNVIKFNSTISNWINEESYKKRNTVRFVTKKEQKSIQDSDLVWIKILSVGLDDFNNPKAISFRRKISNITFFERTYLKFFKTRLAIFSW